MGSGSRLGPLRTAARGLVAGLAGTIAMDLLWYSRYRRGGGDRPFADWEVAKGIEDWADAPAPGRMGKVLIERVSGRELPAEHAATVSNVMHWTYGTAWTAGYGAALATFGVRRAWWHGLAFGGVVWASDYVTLPLAGVYEPVWRYDRETLAKDLSAHLVFGTVADGTLRLLAPNA